MLWSIPISNEDIVTTTPLGVRAITHVFFQDKNGGIFTYKNKPDTVSITIDGRQVCKDVPVLPFCTSTTFGKNRHHWQDVALEVGLNVDFSEIRISAGEKANDYNVVFVTSDKEVDALKGFEYVEWRKINVKHIYTNDEAGAIAAACWDKIASSEDAVTYTVTETRTVVDETTGEVSQVEETVTKSMPLKELWAKAVARCDRNSFPAFNAGEEDAEAWSAFKSKGTETYPAVLKSNYVVIEFAIDEVSSWEWKIGANMGSKEEWVEQQIASIKKYGNTLISVSDVEYNFQLDRAPRRFFVAQYVSQTKTLDEAKPVVPADFHIPFCISSGVVEAVEPRTDMAFYQTLEGVPPRQAMLEFEEGSITKSVTLTTYNTPMEKLKASATDVNSVGTWEILLIFIYRKLV